MKASASPARRRSKAACAARCWKIWVRLTGTVCPVKPFHEIAEVAKNGRRPHHLDAEDVNKGE